jgi:Ca-activated chloride channel family protein
MASGCRQWLLAKKKAEKKYEEAIESGDTPVMLEKSPLGLYTANLGNLKPGEEAGDHH